MRQRPTASPGGRSTAPGATPPSPPPGGPPPACAPAAWAMTSPRPGAPPIISRLSRISIYDRVLPAATSDIIIISHPSADPFHPLTTPSVSTSGLAHTFPTPRGPVHALRDVNLRIEPGQFFGLFGPNGAGKTTLIRILATLILPTGGAAQVHGFDVAGGAAPPPPRPLPSFFLP